MKYSPCIDHVWSVAICATIITIVKTLVYLDDHVYINIRLGAHLMHSEYTIKPMYICIYIYVSAPRYTRYGCGQVSVSTCLCCGQHMHVTKYTHDICKYMCQHVRFRIMLNGFRRTHALYLHTYTMHCMCTHTTSCYMHAYMCTVASVHMLHCNTSMRYIPHPPI